MTKLVLFLPILLIVPVIAYGSTPDEKICWSNPYTDESQTALSSCYKDLITKPFSVITAPFDIIVPGFGMIFIWAPIVFGLWFKTKSPAIAGIFGIIIVGSGIFTGNQSKTAIGIGITLLAVSTGISLIQIFQRIKQTV